MEINYLYFFGGAGRHHTLRCMGNTGICRPSCRKSEQPYLYCLNYQSCCLQSYMRISISGKEVKNDWSQQNRWPKIPWVLVINIFNLLSRPLIKIHAPATLVSLLTIGHHSERLGFAWGGICPVLDPVPWERKLEWQEESRQTMDDGERMSWDHWGRSEGFGQNHDLICAL